MSQHSSNLKIVIVSLFFVCVVVAVVAIFYYLAVTNYRSLGQMRVLVGDIYSNMLTLRRNEKDFLARKDLQYRQKFVDNYEKTLVHLQALRSELQENGVENTRLNQLANNFDSYKNKFLALVELHKEVGLDHKDGLYGSMRDAIHRAEKLLTAGQHNQLSKDMLSLRRHEKDFMLRNDKKYIAKFDQDIAVMQSDLSRAHLHPEVKRQISAAIAAYERDFRALVSATEKRGLSSDEGLHGEMRRSIHRSERILEELRQESLLLISRADGYVISQIAVFAAALMLLVIALILFLPGKEHRRK